MTLQVFGFRAPPGPACCLGPVGRGTGSGGGGSERGGKLTRALRPVTDFTGSKRRGSGVNGEGGPWRTLHSIGRLGLGVLYPKPSTLKLGAATKFS